MFLSASLSNGLLAEAPSKERLHIIYTGQTKKTASAYLTSELERLAGPKDSKVKIKKVILKPSIRIKNLSIYSDVDQLAPESLGNTYQELLKKFTPKWKVDVLKSNFDVIFASTGLKVPLIDQLQTRLKEQNKHTVKIKALIGKVTGSDGKQYDAVLMEDKGPYDNDTWQAQTCFKYTISADGVAGEVISFGNFYGGYASLLPMLEDELKKSKNDVLLLDTGGAFGEYGYKFVEPIFKLLEYDAILPSVFDITSNFEYLLSAKGNFPLVNSNVVKYGEEKPLFKDSIILTKDGVKVGIIGLVSPKHAARVYVKESRRIMVKDPIEAAKRLLKEMSGKVDLVVALVDLMPEELNELQGLSGLNMIIGKDQDDIPPYSDVFMGFKGSKTSLLSYPYFTGTVGNKYFSSVKLYFEKSPDGIQEKSLLWERFPLDIYSKKDPLLQPIENKSVVASYGANDPVLLPDYRELFTDRQNKDITYPASEISSLVANVLLLDTGADVAIYTKRSKLSSSVTGSVTESIIRSWFRDKNEAVVVTRMDGATLSGLVRLMAQYEALGDPTKPPAVVVGVNPSEMTVKEKPISNTEYYTVATVRQVFDAVDLYPQFRGLEPSGGLSGKRFSSTEALIPFLKSKKGTEWNKELEKLISDPDINEGPFFRINIKRVAFEFMGHKVKSSDDYIYVPDVRVQPTDDRTITTNIDTSFELYGSRWNWETGSILDFMTTRITSQGSTYTSEAQDSASLFTDFKYKIWKFTPYFFGRSLGPFFNITYDTQFKPTLGNPRKRQLRFTPGIALSDGTVLDNLRLGWMLEQDYSVSPSDSEKGIYFYTDAKFMLPQSTVSIDSYIDARYFFDADTDTDTDLGVEIELSISVNMPIYRSFFIAPYFKYFLFRGKVDPIRKFGNESTIGVSVGFSEVIKP